MQKKPPWASEFLQAGKRKEHFLIKSQLRIFRGPKTDFHQSGKRNISGRLKFFFKKFLNLEIKNFVPNEFLKENLLESYIQIFLEIFIGNFTKQRLNF